MMMNPAIDHLLQKLFRVNKLEDAHAPDIEQLAGKYPYYAPLQYLLARKYGQVDHTQYRLQITKTAVFFSNPHWLNDLLLPGGDNRAGDDPVHTGEIIPAVSQPAEEIEEGQISTAQNLPEPDEPASSQVVPAELPQEVSSLEEDITPPELSEQNEEAPDWALLKEEANADETIAADPMEMLLPEESPISEATEDHEMVSAPEISSAAGTVPAEFQEDISSGLPGSFPENTKGENLYPQEEAFQNESDFAEQPENGNTIPDDDPAIKVETTLQQGEEPPVTDTPEMTPGGKALQLSSGPDDKLPAIPFEPLYTVDYFASQGIQLNIEEGNDKLSRKLRSFTEWLKTMKRIHPEKLEQEMDIGKSAAIQHIAEHSNELEDVVTEAMAEVYARQGLRAKAAEVYQKLSLLNPNKRAYFAARISKLNDI